MKIDFEFYTQYGTFCDALYFPDDDPLPSDDLITQMKQERLDAWIAFVDQQSSAPPPSKYQRDENGNLILDSNGDPIPLRA
jgi:hypothetical protein